MQSESGHVGIEERAFRETQDPYINPVSSRAGEASTRGTQLWGSEETAPAGVTGGRGRPCSKENRRRGDTPTRAALPSLLPVPISSMPLKAEGHQDLCVGQMFPELPPDLSPVLGAQWGKKSLSNK